MIIWGVRNVFRLKTELFYLYDATTKSVNCVSHHVFYSFIWFIDEWQNYSIFYLTSLLPQQTNQPYLREGSLVLFYKIVTAYHQPDKILSCVFL